MDPLFANISNKSRTEPVTPLDKWPYLKEIHVIFIRLRNLTKKRFKGAFVGYESQTK